MVRLARYKMVLADLIVWSFVHARLAMADLSSRASIFIRISTSFHRCTPYIPQVHGTLYTTFDAMLGGG